MKHDQVSSLYNLPRQHELRLYVMPGAVVKDNHPS